jgi:hypothetical protein
MVSEEPTPRDGLSWHVLDVAGATYCEARLRPGVLLRSLPRSVLGALEAVDPDRQAWVLNANNMCTGTTVAGRRVLGSGRPEWSALEDKTGCAEVWRAAGVIHTPFEIVRARPDELLDAARLDRGAGTVWAGMFATWSTEAPS